MNKKEWVNGVLSAEYKKPLPILSYPGACLSGITVRDMLKSSKLQAQVMKCVADRCDCAAAPAPMDLSVEAECFGAEISEEDNTVPAVREPLIHTSGDAASLRVPEVGSKRSAIFIDTVREAKKLITDRPVLAGCSGPFSLAGRLVGVTEAMFLCYDEPETVECVLEKCTEFLAAYIGELKKAGADGVIIAEPVAGLVSPAFEERFSAPYIRRIAGKTSSDDFLLVYHNCGQNVNRMTSSIYSNGCDAYHFGNASDMRGLVALAPEDKLVLGNVDPVAFFRDGTPEEMRRAVRELREQCGSFGNFVLSSGCDIPLEAKWENIDVFFEEARA